MRGAALGGRSDSEHCTVNELIESNQEDEALSVIFFALAVIWPLPFPHVSKVARTRHELAALVFKPEHVLVPSPAAHLSLPSGPPAMSERKISCAVCIFSGSGIS